MKTREELANVLKEGIEGGDVNVFWFVVGELEREATEEEIQTIKTEAYNEGASDILGYLEEVYGQGIHQTDVWADYMGACQCCPQEEEEGE